MENEIKIIGLRLPAPLYKRVIARMQKTHSTVSEYIRDLIRKDLEVKGAQK
jgi:predicted DNA-binding protein